MLTVPCIRVFRKGILGDYRGPETNPAAIAAYLKEDSLVSVHEMYSYMDIFYLENRLDFGFHIFIV
jgi:hypothetical protein